MNRSNLKYQELNKLLLLVLFFSFCLSWSDPIGLIGFGLFMFVLFSIFIYMTYDIMKSDNTRKITNVFLVVMSTVILNLCSVIYCCVINDISSKLTLGLLLIGYLIFVYLSNKEKLYNWLNDFI